MNLSIAYQTGKKFFFFYSLLFIVAISIGCQKKENEVIKTIEAPAEIHQLNVLNASFFTHQNTKEKIFIAGSDGEIITFDKESNQWLAADTPDFNDKITALASNSTGILLVAVGENGLIAHSSDSGKHWRKRPSPTQKTITTISFDENSKHWIAAGEYGLILISDSTGQHWQQVEFDSASTFSKIVSLPDQIIAIGDNGLIAQSKDGGLDWDIIPPVSTAPLTDITVTNTNTLISSADGNVLRGNVGTNSWEVITTGASTYISRIFFDSNQDILISLGSDGDIFLSDDGGNLWAPVAQQNHYLNNIAQSADGKRLLVVGDKGQLLVSDNAGRTWKTQHSPVNTNIEGAIASGDSGFIVYGESGLLMQQKNSQSEWKIINYPVSEFVHQLLANALDNWIAVGTKGTILTSNNQGKAWQPAITQTQETDYFLSVIQDKRSGNLIAAGPPGTIVVARPNSNEWHIRLALNDSNQGYFHRVIGDDNSTIVAIAGPGTTYYSSDAGENWNSANIDNSKQLFNAIYDHHRQQFIAVGQDGIVQLSPDGKNWVISNTGITQSLQTVYATANSIRAAGDKGALIESTDNGKSWRDTSLASQATILSLFETRDHSFIATGTQGFIARRDNDEKHWQLIDPPTRSSLRTPVQDKDTGIIYVSGKTGEIIYSKDDGISWRLLSPVTQGSIKSLYIDSHNKMLIGVGERLIRVPLLTRND
ncbi:MAG: hypothetical protein B0W54_24205 [Cellvibrio sp. 79]|nr:MAG: hypothetical protein B0W54_24205 [Cellvibrio sp. 79]